MKKQVSKYVVIKQFKWMGKSEGTYGMEYLIDK